MEGDALLRELVANQLQERGILSKLKAQLRANVFLALDENPDFKKEYVGNRQLAQFCKTEEGAVTINLIRDFMQHFGLEFSLSVFNVEADFSGKKLTRSELNSSVGGDTSSPVLTQLVTAARTRGLHTTTSTPVAALNSTYTKPDKVDDSPSSQSTESVEEEENQGRTTPTNEKDDSINLLVFTPNVHKEAKTDTTSKKSLLGNLPSLTTSKSAPTADIKRIFDTGEAQDSGSSDENVLSSLTNGSTADETNSKLSDADATDTA